MKTSIFTSLFILLFVFACQQEEKTKFPQGFFLNDNTNKTEFIPDFISYKAKRDSILSRVILQPEDVITSIPKYVYGNNANVYMTQMVDQSDLLKNIRRLHPNVLRFPGGNLSNLYFWDKQKGELPADVPDTLWGGGDNTYIEEYWFGMNDSSITVSVDNYYKMLEMTGNTGCICVNFSYSRYGQSEDPVAAAAKYAADWVRYDNGRTKFWEIGNENYAGWQAGYKIDTTNNKDGQPEIISGELYGKHFNVFVDSMKVAAKEIGSDIKIGAVLLEENQPWHGDSEKYWNSGFFKKTGNRADFFIVHSYYTPYDQDSDIPAILSTPEHETQKIMDFIKSETVKNDVLMKPLALTEWNIFAVHSKQQTSYVNGIHASLVLGELIKNNYGMACRWNLANAYAKGDDHGMFNQGDEPTNAPKWNPRPVFFYMYYFQKYMGDKMISSKVSGNDEIVAYASEFNNGGLGLVVVNKGIKSGNVKISLPPTYANGRFYMHELKGGEDNGEFSQVVYVNGIGPDYETGGPIKSLEEIKAFSSEFNEAIVVSTEKYTVHFLSIVADN